MSPNEIRILMLMTKVTQAGIARELNVTRPAVNQIIDGTYTSDRIRRKIAEKCGVDITRIWPDPYLTGGSRKAGRPKKA